MIITWTQEDGTVEEVSTEDLSAVEAAALESCTGLSWDEVDDALRAQSPTAMRAVLWVFRRRDEPGLTFSEFDVPRWRRALKARQGSEEIRDMIEALRSTGPSEAHFAAVLDHMRTLAHDPADVDKAVADTAPKAKAKSGRAESAT